jgi:hypothetical protein
LATSCQKRSELKTKQPYLKGKSVFSEQRLIVGIAFIIITGFLKPIFNSVISKANSLDSK